MILTICKEQTDLKDSGCEQPLSASMHDQYHISVWCYDK
jgi:hypothetical protein